MKKFPHISLFRNVLAYVEHVNTDPEVPEQYKITKPVTFEGTIKLHGSNCGVVWTPDGVLGALSRETVLTPADDYKGFAKFVVAHADRIREILSEYVLADTDTDGEDVEQVALYGEWVGPGVVRKNKGSAVSKFQDKHWALFGASIFYTGAEDPVDVSDSLYGVPAGNPIGNVFQAGLWKLTIDFNDPADVEAKETEAKTLTGHAEEQCPYGTLYDLEGAGEGIVWRPVGDMTGREDLYWKCKGKAHSVVMEPKVKKTQPTISNDEKARITAFVDATVTQNRLDQGLDALEAAGHPVHVRSTGKFVQWLTGDVERECTLELDDHGLTWEQVRNEVTARGREFFLTTTRP